MGSVFKRYFSMPIKYVLKIYIVQHRGDHRDRIHGLRLPSPYRKPSSQIFYGTATVRFGAVSAENIRTTWAIRSIDIGQSLFINRMVTFSSSFTITVKLQLATDSHQVSLAYMMFRLACFNFTYAPLALWE